MLQHFLMKFDGASAGGRRDATAVAAANSDVSTGPRDFDRAAWQRRQLA
jgi:hypothetical protein